MRHDVHDSLVQRHEPMQMRLTKLLMIFILYPLALCSLGGIMKSDRDKDGLRGRVRTISTKTVKLSIKDGKLIEESWLLPHVDSFDKHRRKAERVLYNHDGSVRCRDFFSYDPNGNPAKWSRFDATGALISETAYSREPDNERVVEDSYDGNRALIERSVRSYDKKDDQTTVVIYDGQGRLVSKTVEFHDEKGRETEVFICHGNPKDATDQAASDRKKNVASKKTNEDMRMQSLCHDANPVGRMVMSYNDEKNMMELLAYTNTNLLEAKQVVVSDEHEHVIEIADYTAGGNLKSKTIYTREFDSQGNWTKQTTSRWNAQTNTREPFETIYREIAYY